MAFNIRKLTLEQISLENLLILLPFLGSFAFLCSYFYEIGLLSIYRIPTEFAELKTENFIFIFLALSFIFSMLVGLYQEYRGNNRELSKFFKNPIFILIIVFVILIFLITMPIYFPLITVLLVVGIWLNVKRFERKIPKDKPKESKYGHLLLVIASTVIVIWSVCGLSFLVGKLSAIEQHDYVTLKVNKEKLLIIRAYGDKYILGRLDNNEEINGYRIVNSDFLSNKTLKREELLRLNKTAYSRLFK